VIFVVELHVPSSNPVKRKKDPRDMLQQWPKQFIENMSIMCIYVYSKQKRLVSNTSATCCEDKAVHQQTLPAGPPCLFWLVRRSNMADCLVTKPHIQDAVS
jgi:hypothetical protein